MAENRVTFAQYRALLAEYLAPQKGRVVTLAVLLFANIGIQLVNPQIIRHFIDITQAGADTATLTRVALIFIVAAVTHQLIETVATYVSENLSWTSTNSLRSSLARHCLGLDTAFHNAHTPGEMIERIDGDVNALGNFFSRFILQILGNLILMVGIVAALFLEDWRAGGGVLAFVVVMMAILLSLRNIAVPHWEASRQASADLFGFLEERLAGAEDIRSSAGKPYILRRFFEHTRAWFRREVKAATMINIVFNTSLIMFSVGTAVALAIGAYLYTSDAATIGTVYLLFHYTNMLVNPIERITTQLGDLQRAGASIGRINRILSERPTLVDGPGHPLPEGPLSVDLDDVTFGYSPEEPVIHDLSFRLQPGRVLGLLGRTGSGKTTIGRLLLRLYDADRGTIRIGGVDVRDLKLTELRDRVAVVTQNVQMFQASVRDNLTLFDPAIDDDRIRGVIDGLGLAPWLDALEDGLDTTITTGGEGLSAGQNQLIAFARVLLIKNPDLVVLDEASSRLDPATEQLVERSVTRLLEGRTAIIIAHRLSTVQRADEILVLERGRAVEHGARAALAADATSRFSGLLRTGLEDVPA